MIFKLSHSCCACTNTLTLEHTHPICFNISLYFVFVDCMDLTWRQQKNPPSPLFHYCISSFSFKAILSYSLFHCIIHAKRAETPTVIRLYGFSHNVFAASLVIMGLGGSFSPCCANDDYRGGGAKHRRGFGCSCSSHSAMQRVVTPSSISPTNHHPAPSQPLPTNPG